MVEIGLEAPVFVVVSNRADLPDVQQILTEDIAGFILADEDTPEFIARFVKRHFDGYLETLRTPFLGALAEYNQRGFEAWDCPGTTAVHVLQEPDRTRVLRVHGRERVPHRPVQRRRRARRSADPRRAGTRGGEGGGARDGGRPDILRAERHLDVEQGGAHGAGARGRSGSLTTGTITSRTTRGALQLAGGIPVYLETDRNPQGLIGPVDYHAWDEENIREKIRRHPLIKDPDAWRRPRPFRAC